MHKNSERYVVHPTGHMYTYIASSKVKNKKINILKNLDDVMEHLKLLNF